MSNFDYQQNSAATEDKQKLIKGVCCGARFLRDIAISKLTILCKPFSGEKTGAWMTQIVYGCFQDVIDLMCGKYPTTDKCQELEPVIYKDMKTKIENASLLDNSSIAVGIINVISKLDESIES